MLGDILKKGMVLTHLI